MRGGLEPKQSTQSHCVTNQPCSSGREKELPKKYSYRSGFLFVMKQLNSIAAELKILIKHSTYIVEKNSDIKKEEKNNILKCYS